MKRTPTFYLKTILLILGFLVLLSSGIMSVVDKPYVNFEHSDSYGNKSFTTAIEKIEGYECMLWYAIFAAASIIFAIGYFFNKTVNVVLVFVFAPIFAIGIMILTFLETFSLHFGSGPSLEKTLGNGYPVAVCGALLIVIATTISVLRKSNIKTSEADLLDNF